MLTIIDILIRVWMACAHGFWVRFCCVVRSREELYATMVIVRYAKSSEWVPRATPKWRTQGDPLICPPPHARNQPTWYSHQSIQKDSHNYAQFKTHPHRCRVNKYTNDRFARFSVNLRVKGGIMCEENSANIIITSINKCLFQKKKNESIAWSEYYKVKYALIIVWRVHHFYSIIC